jgi:hypothetical protein
MNGKVSNRGVPATPPSVSSFWEKAQVFNTVWKAGTGNISPKDLVAMAALVHQDQLPPGMNAQDALEMVLMLSKPGEVDVGNGLAVDWVLGGFEQTKVARPRGALGRGYELTGEELPALRKTIYQVNDETYLRKGSPEEWFKLSERSSPSVPAYAGDYYLFSA